MMGEQAGLREWLLNVRTGVRNEKVLVIEGSAASGKSVATALIVKLFVIKDAYYPYREDIDNEFTEMLLDRTFISCEEDSCHPGLD